MKLSSSPSVFEEPCSTYSLFLRTEFSPLTCPLVLAVLVIFEDVSRLLNVWQAKRAMLLYILAELIDRAGFVVVIYELVFQYHHDLCKAICCD